MKRTPSCRRAVACLAILCGAPACTVKTAARDSAAESAPGGSTGYDSALAARLGADDYGMGHYVMAFLKPGPNRGQDSATAADLQRAHLANIQRLAGEGKLLMAGPFLDDGSVAGIFVFDVATVDEARALTESDPAVQAGRLTIELHPWYGPAALRELAAINERITKLHR